MQSSSVVDRTVEAAGRWIRMHEGAEVGADVPAEINRTIAERPSEAAQLALETLETSIAAEMEDGAHYEAAVAFRQLGESFIKLFIQPHEATSPALAANGYRMLTSLLMMPWDAGVMDAYRSKYLAAKNHGRDGGLTPKPVPAWVAPALPGMANALARDPEPTPWAVAGKVAKEVRGAPSQQAVFNYIKEHSLIPRIIVDDPTLPWPERSSEERRASMQAWSGSRGRR
jgi:hypothetical protein